MNRWHRTSVVLAGAVVLAVTGCGSPPPASPPPPPPAAAPSSAPAATGTPYATAAPLAEKIDWANQLEDLNAVKFGASTTIDNTWLPLKPGMQFVYEGFADHDGEKVPKRFVMTVTDLTKTIMGVKAVVVSDKDYEAGALVEDELAFYAQADGGDVWHLGEYPEAYENGRVVETPTWIGGIAGASPGIFIKQQADLGGPSYSQGFSPTVPWTDRARVGQVGVKDCVRQGCYDNGIVAEEFNREEPGAVQLKYYAPGLGNTRVSFTGPDAAREQIELVSAGPLDAAALADVRAKALALEQSGFKRSRAVYALTTPMERPPGT